MTAGGKYGTPATSNHCLRMREYKRSYGFDHCIVHVHIPRTGGTTLRNWLLPRLLEHLSPAEIYLVDIGPEHGCRTGSIADLVALGERQRRRLRFVTGHVAPAVAELVGRPVLATLVRDPVERALSDYWYCFHEPSNPAHAKARELSELEFVARGFGQSRNGHARYLSGVAISGEQISDEALFARAKHGLDRMDYVGIFEQLDDAVDDLCELAGVERSGALPWLNEAARLRPASGHDRRLIAAHNWVDSALYGIGLGRWLDQRRRDSRASRTASA